MAIERLGRRSSGEQRPPLMASTASVKAAARRLLLRRDGSRGRAETGPEAPRPLQGRLSQERNAPIGIERTPRRTLRSLPPPQISQRPITICFTPAASSAARMSESFAKSSHSVARSCQPPSPGRPVIRFMSSVASDAWMNSSDTPGRRSRIVRSQYALRSSSGRCWSTGHRKSGKTMPALANSSRKPAAPLVASSSCEAILTGRANSCGQLLVDRRDVELGRRPGVVPVCSKHPHVGIEVRHVDSSARPRFRARQRRARGRPLSWLRSSLRPSTVLAHRDDRVRGPSDRDPTRSYTSDERRNPGTDSPSHKRRSPETTGMAP